ncbi:MAG: carboxypeptidase-like regulatory domain-containing protein [Bacteroidota bacterium]
MNGSKPEALAQDSILQKPVDISAENQPVFEVLVALSQDLGYHFSYSSGLIPSDRRLTLHKKEIMLRQVLNQIFDSTSVEYQVLDKQIIIKSRYRIPSDTSSYEVSIYPYREISGFVKEANSGKPVPFASVSLVGKPVGTITNTDGSFSLKIPQQFINDTIDVSSMGYKSIARPIAAFTENVALFLLEIDLIPIQEVIIRKTDPLGLISQALDKIPDNYATEPARYTTFYREATQRNEEYVALSEAVLYLYKTSYNNPYSNDQVKVFKSRKSIDISKLDTVTLKLKGGIETSLLLDLAKNPADFLQKDNFALYEFKVADIVSYDNHPTYAIAFDQRPEVNLPLFKGRLYIDIETLAIRGAEFELSPRGIVHAGNTLVVKQTRRFKTRPTSAKYYVRYRQIGEKFYLNHVRFETEFKVRKKRKLFSTTFKTITELAVNNIDTTDVRRFRYREIARIDDIFIDQVQTYDPSFWGHLNFIPPDESLEEAMERINSILD